MKSYISYYNTFYITKKDLEYTRSLAGVVGIEPTSGVLETLILPMNYTPILQWLITTTQSI